MLQTVGQLLADNTCENCIYILDMFGFEQADINGFEQLCINYSSECLHSFFQEHIFQKQLDACHKESIDIGNLNYQSNRDILKLLEVNSLIIFV
jgi:myosin heavy subunit